MGFFSRKKAEPEEVKPRLVSKTAYFDVANSRGSKATNEQGDDIQEILDTIPKKIIRANGDKLWGGYTKKDMKEYDMSTVSIYQDYMFDCDIQDGKVYLLEEDGGWHIGNIPKKDIKELDEIITSHDRWHYELYIDGGLIKNINGDERQVYNRPHVSLVYWEEV